MTIRSLGGKTPQIDPTAFVSEAAYIIGDVVIGPRSSVWPGAVIRADSGRITIGAGSNVQDNAALHADADAWIGDGVTIGHLVMCHARNIGNGCLIGNGAVLNDGVELGESCLIAAGSTVTENTVFPPRTLVRGTPGKALGTIRDRHEQLQRHAAEAYVKRVARYKAEGGLESR
jgi:carbonic anhydrase/acetyltransferase-like protein (isoleucine patch superfamily)